jgi:hypothetical protein
MTQELDLPEFVHKAPSLTLISGSTGSGKTSLLYAMVHYIDKLFDKPVRGVVVCYAKFQELYTKMSQNCPVEVILHYGLPSKETVLEYKKQFNGEHWVLAVDDLAHSSVNDPEMLQNYILGSHHDNYSLIQLQQSFFTKGKFAREMSTQIQYAYLLANRRYRNQITTIGSQMFPGQAKEFRQCFEDAISMNQPEVGGVKIPSYLLVSMHPHQERDLELTTMRLPPGGTLIIYRL